MSRQSFGLKNTRVSLFFYLILLFLTFFSRKVFIDTLGVELVGLTSTMLNILNVVNLSELGIGTAIATTLYSPLYANRRKEVDDIVSILGFMYRIIGFVVIGIGVLLLASMPFLFDDKGISMGWVYVTFAAMFISNLVPYFISYQQTLLDADQKFYEITAATNSSVFVRVVIQIVLLKFLGMGYGAWLITEVVFSILLGVWLVYRVRKLYPWLNVSWKRGRDCRMAYPQIFRKSRQVIPHRISNAVLNQTDNILLLLLVSLESVTLYTNYSLLMRKSVTLVATTFNGLTASVGNLIAEGNMESVKKLFWEFNALFFVIASVLAIEFFYMVNPFVALWLGDEFVLGMDVVILLVFNTFLTVMRLPLTYFTNGYSLFKDVWAPCCEAGINLVISIILGYKMGIVGVMAGTAISLTFMQIWKPYFFYREIFLVSVMGYWSHIFKYILTLLAVGAILHFLIISRELLFENSGFLVWIANAVIIAVVSVVGLWAGMFLLSQGMRDLTRRLINILLK